jgi:integrating conjugative element protein (TIGR03765 family)
MECNVAKTWSRVVAAVLWTCLAVLIGWAIGARFGEAFAAPPKEARQSGKSSTAVPSIAVLFDTGKGVPVGPLLTQLVGSKDAEAVSPVFEFPIEAQGLIPGELSEDAERRWPGAKWLVQPIYLVGDDPASERWLRLNAERLGALGATGLLVQVRDAREFRRLEGSGRTHATRAQQQPLAGEQVAGNRRRRAAVAGAARRAHHANGARPAGGDRDARGERAMSSTHVLEAKLRPPIELWSASVAVGCALVALLAPWALMMTPLLGALCALICLGFAYWRGKQAWQVLRYQHGLKYYKVTRIAPHRIPVPPGELYLGQGFEWGQLHTQRKVDASRP